MSAPAVQPLPPPLRQPASHRPKSWFPWKLVFGTIIVAALLILAEYSWLRDQKQARSIAWANEQVEDKIEAARVLLTEQHWDEAIRQLEDALDLEGATNLDTVRLVLEEARRGQAETLLEAAGIALGHRQIGDALHLLRVYLAHPQAGQLARARLLRDELERALSDDEAARLLDRLSEEELAVFEKRGQLTMEDGMHTTATRAIFQETLRRNLRAELRRREAQREVSHLTAQRRAVERAGRIARLRDTPTFHSLSSFLAQIQEQWRDQQQLASRQDVELRVLFRELAITDATEQQQVRADLLGRQTPSMIREQVERKRSEVKRVFRNEPEFNRADAEFFDQLVDQEVDQLLKILRVSG